jgi:Protein of unknown function/AsmA-like C-terminal region
LLRRGLLIVFEIIAALIAGVAILIGFTAWRLADGHPVHLGFLVPYFERSLAAPDRTFKVKLDDLIVTWTGGEQLLSIRAIGVRALSEDGRELASVPQIGLRLSVRAMMRGLVAPTEIEVFDPRIHVRRNRDGTFQFLATVASAGENQPSSILPEIFGDLMGPPNPDTSTGYLQRAHLVGGELVFDDQRTGLLWHAPKIDIDLLRDREGIVGRLSGQVVELGEPALVDVSFTYNSASRSVRVHGRYHGVDIASLGLIAPDLYVLSNSQLTFDGSLDTTANLDGRIGAMQFTINSGPGQIDLPNRLDQRLAIAGLTLAGQLDAGADTLALDTFTLDLGGPKVTATGKLSGLISQHTAKSGRVRFNGRLTVNNVPVPQLRHLWPVSGGDLDNPRAWIIDDIDQGVLNEAEANFDVDFAGGDFGAPNLRVFGGKLKATGLELYYLAPLPPMRGVDGTATFDAGQFVADFGSGGVGKLALKRGHLVISGLDKVEQIIAVEGDVEGPVHDALVLLDNPRLGFPRKVGIDPATSGGVTQTHLTFRFPAIKVLPFEKVQLTAKSKIENASLGHIFLGHDLTEGNFDLDLDNKGMEATGQAKLAGIPASLHWNLHFDGAEYNTRIALAANTSADDLARLGFDYRNVINGPLRTDLVFTEFKNHQSEVVIGFDLINAVAEVEFAKWKKPAGSPGHATIKMALEGQRPTAISAFDFQSGVFTGNGHGRFSPDGKLAQATFDNVILGQTRLNAVTVDFVGERWDIRVGGGVFDAEPFVPKTKVGAGDTPPAPPLPPPGEEKPTRPYTLVSDHLDRVVLGPGRAIENVRLKAAYDGLHWLSMEADGSLPGGKLLALRWLPAAGSTHQLSVTADDAGAALKLLDIVGNVVGGRLTITGSASDADPRRAIKGHAEISEYRLVKQSALIRLLTIATLTGLADALTGEGFQMYKFIADFTKTGGRIDIPLARTYGPSLGLTATGFLDYDTDKLDIRGTVVPAYALNSLIGQIPIVGYLLTGGEGTGMFAVIYNATGKLSQPTIIVNPLSALAPGFLRGVFNMFPSGGGTPSALPPNVAPGKKN